MSYAYKIGSEKIKLKQYDANFTAGLNKEKAQEHFNRLNAELDSLQEEMYAAGTHSILMILQGMDTSGKDGAIRHVLRNVDPQGCRVESFKAPTEEELAHDFLWRVHKVVPRRGMFGVFNRSHYEDVIVVRVHDLVPERVWKARYEQINQFEALLTSGNTIVLKFFLHISNDEQEQRLLAREQDAVKAWKLSAGDWREREHWDDYMKAYEDMLNRCNTKSAPWYIVPANKKWFRNLAISEVLVETMKEYLPSWQAKLDEMRKKGVEELKALRSQKGKV